MKIQTLIATMNRKSVDDLKKLLIIMNVKQNAVIVNQTKDAENFEIMAEKSNVFLFTNQIGLSKSRNMAISNADADIIVIADDDLQYFDNYQTKIIDAYKKYPDADAIAFYVESSNADRPTSKINKEGRIGYLKSMKLSSFQLSFKRESLNGLGFKEEFGAGARYKMGEENIFLFEFLKNKNKIYYVDETIAIVHHAESTWFTSFDKKFFNDMGRIYKEMFGYFAGIMIIQYAVRKHKRYKKDNSMKDAIKYMLEGMSMK